MFGLISPLALRLGDTMAHAIPLPEGWVLPWPEPSPCPGAECSCGLQSLCPKAGCSLLENTARVNGRLPKWLSVTLARYPNALRLGAAIAWTVPCLRLGVLHVFYRLLLKDVARELPR